MVYTVESAHCPTYYVASLDLEKCYDNVDTSLLYDLIEKLLYSDRAEERVEEECTRQEKKSSDIPSCRVNGNRCVTADKSILNTGALTRARIGMDVRSVSRAIDRSGLDNGKDEKEGEEEEEGEGVKSEDVESEDAESEEEEGSDDGYLVHKYSVAHYISRCFIPSFPCHLRVQFGVNLRSASYLLTFSMNKVIHISAMFKMLLDFTK